MQPLIFHYSLFIIHFLKPRGGRSVTRHAPVATRTDGNRSDLRAIREARSLELLVEEATAESLQPLTDGIVIIDTSEAALCQHEDLGRTEPASHEVKQEEVVQLVRTYQVFRLLLDIALLVSRNQFRTDRCINYI